LLLLPLILILLVVAVTGGAQPLVPGAFLLVLGGVGLAVARRPQRR
jgi:uncharacterized protein YqgC (DUF456 family)